MRERAYRNHFETAAREFVYFVTTFDGLGYEDAIGFYSAYRKLKPIAGAALEPLFYLAYGEITNRLEAFVDCAPLIGKNLFQKLANRQFAQLGEFLLEVCEANPLLYEELFPSESHIDELLALALSADYAYFRAGIIVDHWAQLRTKATNLNWNAPAAKLEMPDYDAKKQLVVPFTLPFLSRSQDVGED